MSRPPAGRAPSNLRAVGEVPDDSPSNPALARSIKGLRDGRMRKRQTQKETFNHLMLGFTWLRGNRFHGFTLPWLLFSLLSGERRAFHIPSETCGAGEEAST